MCVYIYTHRNMFFLVDYIMIICEYIWVWSWWTCLYEIIDVCLFYLKMYTNKNIWSFTIMYGCVWLRIFCRFTSRKATPHLLGTSNRDVNGDTYNREKFWLWLVQGIQYMFPSLKFAYFFSSASFSPCVPVLVPATRRFRKNRWDFRLPVWSLVTPGNPHGDGKGMPEGKTLRIHRPPSFRRKWQQIMPQEHFVHWIPKVKSLAQTTWDGCSTSRKF